MVRGYQFLNKWTKSCIRLRLALILASILVLHDTAVITPISKDQLQRKLRVANPPNINHPSLNVTHSSYQVWAIPLVRISSLFNLRVSSTRVPQDAIYTLQSLRSFHLSAYTKCRGCQTFLEVVRFWLHQHWSLQPKWFAHVSIQDYVSHKLALYCAPRFSEIIQQLLE